MSKSMVFCEQVQRRETEVTDAVQIEIFERVLEIGMVSYQKLKVYL